MKKEKQGFSLIEIMVVMAIIAVLATLVIGAVQLARRTATETTHRSNAKTIQVALEANYAKFRYYCGQTGEIACGTYSFSAAAGATTPAVTNNLGVSLGSAFCTAVGQLGGGSVTINTTSYTISPQNFDCSAVLTNDVLTM